MVQGSDPVRRGEFGQSGQKVSSISLASVHLIVIFVGHD
jgi:hypothetical protein